MMVLMLVDDYTLHILSNRTPGHKYQLSTTPLCQFQSKLVSQKRHGSINVYLTRLQLLLSGIPMYWSLLSVCLLVTVWEANEVN